MLAVEASDLHLSSGSPPHVRIHGVIQHLPGAAPLTEDQLLELLHEILPPRNREEYERRNDTDFAYSIPGASRFRVNIFRDRYGPGAVFRAIPFQIRTPEELGLPASVLELCSRTKGLVLVTGPTGSGKSTTLATLIDHINRNRTDHIVTIEDPIEFVHENRKCLVNQREVHSHTDSFKDALRAALREDPDIVLVGEMRDLETIAIAVETAETGHLVFGTLHTSTAPSTIDRVIDQFPADRQDQIRQMLASSLIGVVAQVLCRKIGGGRVAAYEILIGGSAVSNLIRERKTYQIYSIIQTGRAQGMMTMNDSLMNLVRSKVIDINEAYRLSVNKTEMATLLAREGLKVASPES
jgi:twitching motility protein PilT